MQLSPVYGQTPIVALHSSPSNIVEPVRRQRERLGALLETLTDDQFDRQSRCDGWTVRDVVVHLTSVNQYWAFSIASGLQGTPSELLATFDPVRGPAEMTAAAPQTTTRELVAEFQAASAALTELVDPLTNDQLLMLAEAPLGHLTIAAVLHHALWDSWTHERDIMVPLGLDQGHEDDEILRVLQYVLALSPAFARSQGQSESGVLVAETEKPEARIVVSVADRVEVSDISDEPADLTIRGDAASLIEQLSFRTPFEVEVPDDTAWMFSGLAAAFEVE